jgi:hypothetical protein
VPPNRPPRRPAAARRRVGVVPLAPRVAAARVRCWAADVGVGVSGACCCRRRRSRLGAVSGGRCSVAAAKRQIPAHRRSSNCSGSGSTRSGAPATGQGSQRAATRWLLRGRHCYRERRRARRGA